MGIKKTQDKISSDWANLEVLLGHEMAIKVLQAEGHNTTGTLSLHESKVWRITSCLIDDIVAGVEEYNREMQGTADFKPLDVPDGTKLNTHIRAGIEGYRKSIAGKINEHFAGRGKNA